MAETENAITAEITLGPELKIAENLLNAQTAHLEAGEVRAFLEAAHGQNNVWNDEQFSAIFAVSYFDPPLIHVIRRDTKTHGTVYFTNSPRFYFSFNAESAPHA
jgi:hypothetical protein